MSLRDFNNAPFPDDPRALHNEPLGNGAGLESFHTTLPQDIARNSMPKILGAVAVVLMIGAAGVALYTSAGSGPKPVMTASNPPAAPASQPPASQPESPAASMAMTPDASAPTTAKPATPPA